MSFFTVGHFKPDVDSKNISSVSSIHHTSQTGDRFWLHECVLVLNVQTNLKTEAKNFVELLLKLVRVVIQSETKRGLTGHAQRTD